MRARKLNTLLLTAALLTTGGVYASWSYAQAAVASATVEKNLELDTLLEPSAKGTINVVENGLTFLVVNDGAYKASLEIQGSLTVSFTPNPGADADVIANGIPLQISIQETLGDFNGEDILTVGANHVLNDGNPILTNFVINGTADPSDPNSTGISKHLTLGDIVLDTYEEYDSFKTALNNGKITIVISEYVAPNP